MAGGKHGTLLKRLKFNIIEPKDNLKLSLYTLEKGVTMNDEIVHWLEENKDVVVQVVTA